MESSASASFIEGTSGADVFKFASAAALAAPAAIYGDGGTDTVKITAAAALSDADFAHLHAIHTLALTGDSDVTLGPDAAAAGVVAVAMGADGGTVDAGAMSAGKTLTLTGAGATVVTVGGNLAAGAYKGALSVAATGGAAQILTLGSGADSLTASYGDDTIAGGAGGDHFDIVGHRHADTFIYKATSDSLNEKSAHDIITGFADTGDGASFNDVVDFSAIKTITKFKGELASASAQVDGRSVAYIFAGGDTLILANAGEAALSPTSGKLMEIELAGGEFALTSSNFRLA
jgi:hypothetical protein